MLHPQPIPSVAKRPPEQVMRLQRMGAFHQTRLSFMRALLRQIRRESWTFTRTVWEINDEGVGVAVYQACSLAHTYSLVCFAHDLPVEKRSDRVIADAWDATFALFDGVPAQTDIERMARNVPLQEAGHCTESELVLARANRSVRLFAHVVDRLAEGHQPDPEFMQQVGYLMRTTAVYGNGKFGLGDRERIAQRPEFVGAFRAELLAVWLIRWFTVDIVEHLARVRSPATAVPMEPEVRAMLGVGNSTGLGMAPFLVTHPGLLHSWIDARETALMRVRHLAAADSTTGKIFHETLARVRKDLHWWQTNDSRQRSRIRDLHTDLIRLETYLESGVLAQSTPWDQLIRWSETHLTLEGQELLVSLVIEPHGALVDDLADHMALDELPLAAVDGAMRVDQARALLRTHYDWALNIDFQSRDAIARFWYVSEEKLEPRLGERDQEPGAEQEQPLAFGWEMQRLLQDLDKAPGEESMAAFLMANPEYRSAVRRLQLVQRMPYAEIQDNLIAADMVPIDLLRCKLSFFGATRFDPKSDRWVRIAMYQNAPYPDTLYEAPADDWIYPAL